MLVAVLPTRFTSIGPPSGEMIVVLFTELPSISNSVDLSLTCPKAVDASRRVMEIITTAILNLSPPIYN
jgi:hypothetical protein